MNKCKLTPLDHFIIIKEYEVNEKSDGGIVMPETYKEQWQLAITEGEIIALGENAFDYLQNKPKVGDWVLFNKYEGHGRQYKDGYFRSMLDTKLYAMSEQMLTVNEALLNERE